MRQPQASPLIERASLQSIYNLTDAWTNITGLSLTATKDGLYEIVGACTVYVVDLNALAASGYVRFAKDNNGLMRTTQFCYHADGINAQTILAPYSCNVTIYLKADETITMQGKMDTGDDCAIRGGTDTEAYLELRRK